jgi:hypothetical protein
MTSTPRERLKEALYQLIRSFIRPFSWQVHYILFYSAKSWLLTKLDINKYQKQPATFPALQSYSPNMLEGWIHG